MSKCVERVNDGGMWPKFHQCSREARVEREGKGYCTIHDPVLIAQRNAEKEAKWDAEWKAKLERSRLANAATDMYVALKVLLSHYVQMINSGDCGSWDPEDDPEIKQARAALAKAEGKPTQSPAPNQPASPREP